MIDLTYLRTISDNNQDFINQMIQSFLDCAPVYLREIEVAVADEDFKTLSQAVHKLKPSATYMGIETLLQQILILEAAVKTDQPDRQIIAQYTKEIARLCQEAYPIIKAQLK